jgi:uncharacterized protein YfaP (DUF2135 family)
VRTGECDNFDLTVAAPPTGMQGVLTVDLTWNNTTAGGTDLDLFVVAPDGTTSGPGSPDDMSTGAGRKSSRLQRPRPEPTISAPWPARL